MRAFVSFVIPTYNAGSRLASCLESIKRQRYPKNRMEILVADGFSKDNTRRIAEECGARVLDNPRIDAESGGSIGISNAKGEFIVLLGADNVLDGEKWLKAMLKPLIENRELFGAESVWVTKRDEPFLNRYSAALQVADPLARALSPRLKAIKKDSYIIYEAGRNQFPVTGANGFVWRKSFIKRIGQYKPMFEETNYVAKMVMHGYNRYARSLDAGTYHYHVKGLADFVRKRVKIGRKFMARRQKKQATWVNNPLKLFLAALFCGTFVGPAIEAFFNCIRSRKIVWLVHPFMCFITVLIYLLVFANSIIGRKDA